MGMGMNRQFAQLVSFRSIRRNRWYGSGVSACLAQFETGASLRRRAVNWDKVLGLATVLGVVAISWILAAFAISRFLR